ncbi:hypothetical protein G5C33_13460 [Sphingosinithalassobacter tenebrarum]|uniref:Preprotein translocase subunit YajC n=1 Tax=Stakelama tenebrarum TaxID=2711215 RepID=A0A6G6YBI3_9SPHN|nr:hypothetical protein G5C33_13460 [Sphingosinithalassobacter tenebrarum]
MRIEWLGSAAVGALALAANPAHAQSGGGRHVDITPHIDVAQVLTADLQDGDVLTYTNVSAGVDASVQTRRVQVQLSYTYTHQFAYDSNTSDGSVHSGLARAAVAVAPGFTIEGGAIATRARSDIRGDAPGNTNDLAADNVSQIYSAYAGPSFATQVGAINVNAGYRFGYTRAEAPGVTGVDPDAPPLDVYDDSTSHSANVSVGVASGTVLPVGVTVSGAWEREDAGQLDQRYEGKYGRGDIVVPVSRGVALVGGVGYESIQISQRDALLDASDEPVRDAAGRFVTDPDSPRRLAYDTDGLFWDAGVVYRPSRRTMVEARVGRRYDSWSYTGSLSYQFGRGSAVQVGVYDSIQSFGRQLNNGIASLPTSYTTGSDPLGSDYNGCVTGTNGAAGGCLNGVFQSVATSNYRARGVDAVVAFNGMRSRWGVGAGYSNREFIAPDTGTGFSVDGLTDESLYAQLFGSSSLTPQSSLSGNVYVNYYRSEIPGSNDVFGWGVNTSYSHSFGRLSATAAIGLYGFDRPDPYDDSYVAQGLFGLSYGF